MASALDWLMRQLGGDPEAEGAVTTSSAIQPAVLDHLQNVLSDMPGRFGGGASYDPNRSLAQNALDPESLQQATTIGMQVGPAAIRAYHGSPHDFDRFDLSKIGTGEGAQVYGHGLYFAGREPVARSYRDALSSYGLRVGDRFQKVDPSSIDDVALAHLESFANLPDPYAQARRTLEETRAVSSDASRRSMDRALDVLNQWEKQGAVPASSGKMYEVDLHADPARLLDWDKPLSEQSPQVRQILDREWLADPSAHANQSGGTIYDKTARQAAFNIGRGDFNYSGASEILREAGIPGIRYFDQGSRNAGAGTSNYAMFDDKLIEILRKYGLAGLTAGTGAAALGGSAEAAPADALDRIKRQLGEGAF